MCSLVLTLIRRQAHKIQCLCQGAYTVFNARASEVYSLHGWWLEAWPKENSFMLFQEELCQGSKSCPVFWLCVWAFSLLSQWAESCEYHHQNGTTLCGTALSVHLTVSFSFSGPICYEQRNFLTFTTCNFVHKIPIFYNLFSTICGFYYWINTIWIGPWWWMHLPRSS